ncbi:MAG: DUF4349 domain-containing protein [Pseudomonadota bacterium]|nr:DUF4349 domain-containing protein [Pseudomonadota bacterium]
MIALLVGVALAASHIDGAVTVQVDDRDKAIAAVIGRAEAAGGWFTALSDESVSVSVPSERATAVLDGAKELGLVVERSWSVSDLDTELIDLRARLASREGVLTRYLDILSSAHASAVVAVEREITRTVAEIEQIQGRIRLLEHRATYAQLGFSFRFRDRAAPTRDGSSSFGWLNTLNLADLQDAFRSGRYFHTSRGVTVSAPAGFAPGKKTRRFVAVSPDDVVFRVRTVKNEPEADLAFWKEAMTTRMTAAGYRVVAGASPGGNVKAGDVPGALLELSAPDGAQDAAYLVAVFVDGGRLVIVESAGEVARFAGRRAAVVAAIEAMEI